MKKETAIDVKDFEKREQKMPIISKSSEYLTPEEYAALVKKHRVTVYKWLEAGKIEGAIKLGRCWRIPVTT